MRCFPWNLPVYSKVTVSSYCKSSLNSIDCLQKVCSPRMSICWKNPTSTVARLAAVYPRGKWKAVCTRVLSLAVAGIVRAAKQKRCEFSVPPPLSVEEALWTYYMGYSLRRAFNSCLDPRKLFVTKCCRVLPCARFSGFCMFILGREHLQRVPPCRKVFSLSCCVAGSHTPLTDVLRKSFREGASLF